ncbi:MAG: hypothetical protein A2583_08590 [Bdellovibrionales bacterium RIFOXYD1_FULL_53_11]|nr:MAG: hypothetical protein A2583_08590 [Bdellovibrionales bacterium RIFOXYD1_FULL_53_11]
MFFCIGKEETPGEGLTATSESSGVAASGGSGGPFTPQAAAQDITATSTIMTIYFKGFMLKT